MLVTANTDELQWWKERCSKKGWDFRSLSFKDDLGGLSHIHLISPSTPSQWLLHFHGTGESALAPGADLLQYMLERGIAVASAHLPGHGVHDSTQLTTDTLESCLPLVWQTLASHGIEPTTAVGFSLGGTCIAAGLRRYQVPLRKAVFLAAPSKLNIRPWVGITEVAGSFSQTMIRHIGDAGLGGALPAIGPFGRKRFPIRFPDGPCRGFAYPRRIKEILLKLELWNSVDAPKNPDITALGIYGEKDPIVHEQSCMDLLQGFHAARSEILPGCNHYMVAHLERSHQLIHQLVTSNQDTITPLPGD